ncbi:MAG: diacylglycerol kinase family protein [Clostridia bacterium]|nr:diacylglycerol kinase family protein [Clostridia bacterium]
MTYILFNPLAGGGQGEARAQALAKRMRGRDVTLCDVTKLDAAAFLRGLPGTDVIILAGGDGTLNHFANALNGVAPTQTIYYYPTGSGNDFMNDVRGNAANETVLLNPCLRGLPTVEVNGARHAFLNGIGYGIDGYCCEVGDRLRAEGKQKINYAGIAIKGLLFHFRPMKATVTVDGRTRTYKNVWLAPTMKGRFYGGGMNIAPAQDRQNPDGTVSAVVLHCRSRLKTLIVFPSIFKGEHVKHTEMVDVLSGHDVLVRFDRPCALQIDGETVKNVTEYRVRGAEPAADAREAG